jgi:hypothetical protein
MPWSHRQTLVPLGLVVAVALGVALHAHLARGPAAAGLLEQPRQNTAQLYQIGDQEFLAMNSGISGARRMSQVSFATRLTAGCAFDRLE